MTKDRFPDYAGRRVLVTGGLGFIGSVLTRRLVEQGAAVTVLERYDPAPGGASGLDYEHRRCDLLDMESLVPCVGDASPELVFHLAAAPDGQETYEHARAAIETNVLATLNLLESIRLVGGAPVVYGDSTKAYGEAPVPYRESAPLQPLSSYAVGKVAGWQTCELYRRVHGMPCVSLRPTLIYGPGQPLNLISYVITRVLAGDTEIPLLGGSQTRDPLFIEDAVLAYLETGRRVSTIPGRAINIGGGTECSIADLAKLIVDVMGSDAKIVERSDQRRPTDTARSYCDNAEAQALLGWTPGATLREGLRQTVEFIAGASSSH